MNKQQYKELIDNLLREHSKESIQQLVLINEDEDFISNYASDDTELGYIYISVCIYREEQNNNIKNGILSVDRTMKELINVICRCKFLLWRIELMKDFDALDLFIKYADSEKLSIVFIMEIVRIGSMNPINTLIKLGDAFIRHLKEPYAFKLLMYANSIEAGNEQVVCMLADMCIKYGNKESAKKLLESINQQGIHTEIMKEKVYADE